MRTINYFCLLVAIIFVSCNDSKPREESIMDESVETIDSTSAVNKELIEETKVAISLWPKTGLYDKPGKTGKWQRSVKFGSKLEVLELMQGDNGKEYARVKTIDGFEGWIKTYLIAQDAYYAVSTGTPALYNEADIISLADKKLDFGEFVVAKNEKVGDFIYVQTSEKKKKGYLKKEKYLSTEDNDIVVAILRERALAMEGDKKTEAIQEILENEDYKESVFYQDLKNSMEVEANKEIEEMVNDATEQDEEMMLEME